MKSFRLLALLSTLVTLPAAARAEPAPALLVKNALIFSMAPNQDAPFQGYFTVDTQGKILAVAQGTPPASLHAARIFDAHGHWIMPGFISAHSHLWQAAYRGLAQDKTLTGWLAALYGQEAPRAATEDFYWFALYGALDHLSHGITAAYNFNLGRLPADASGVEPIDRAEFRGETDSGIRFVHGIDPVDGSDDSLEASRHHISGFLNWVHAQPTNDRLLSVMLNGMTAFRDNPDQAAHEKALMDEFHIGNQTHYLEPPDLIQKEQSLFPLMQKAGLLGPTLIFGHYIHTTPEIIAASGAAKVAMSWNPLSNGRLASGVADIPAYLKAGIRVGMGVDGEASADLSDPFENIRAGLYAIRDKYQDAAVMSPRDVVRLHTLGSADALGVKDRLGSIEPGKLADFLVIDPTHFAHVFDPWATLVFVAAESDLERVYVGGVQMVDHGHLLHQDMARVENEVNHRVAISLEKPEPKSKWP